MNQEQNKPFDRHAIDYDDALRHGLAASGEERSYFAHGRAKWLRDRLVELSVRPQKIMDYGCGDGSSSPLLLQWLGAERVVGTDESLASLEIARRRHGSPRIEFLPTNMCSPGEQFDLVFCNGVFHHIAPSNRTDALRYVFTSLRAGGLFALWENNPWNPGTRYVMSRIPFDRDAITLNAIEARRLARAGGFEILRTDFLFIFPRTLSCFRMLEPFCSRLPLGAQYQILCRKP